MRQEITDPVYGREQSYGLGLLGPLFCWAVVFTNIGSSIYYAPGILYEIVGIGPLAGFFVFLTMSVFVLLTLKYAEVTHRFPQGGGTVTVAAYALNQWFGALGGMFVLLAYFLTAALSCMSSIQYVSVVVPAISPYLVLFAIAMLVLLGILNWVADIRSTARIAFIGAIVAFISDLAILFTVFTHLSFTQFLSLIPSIFASHPLTLHVVLVGFANSFLAFSGLESISQFSPFMKYPHRKIAGQALLLIVLTVGLTSPLLTMLSTVLLPKAAADSVLRTQLISLLAGHWGSIILQTEVAISSSAMLILAA